MVTAGAGRAANNGTSPKPRTFTVGPLSATGGDAIVVYGTGGIGKTCLAALAPEPIFIDLDCGAAKVPGVRAVHGVESWADLRAALHDMTLWAESKTIVIDSGTAAQRLAEAHTVQNVPHEKGHYVSSVEGYGFGKGYQHVLETFQLLLSDLDAHRRAGRHVILVCHGTVAYAPNPSGDDFLRNEPDLYNPPKTGRIRDRVKNWCDHMLFIDYDKIVKDGKAFGAGTRTIYCQEMPDYWAKSRSLGDPIPYSKGSTDLWDALFGKVVNNA